MLECAVRAVGVSLGYGGGWFAGGAVGGMMEHNLDFGPEAQANHALAALRGLSGGGPIEADRMPVPGVWFALDPESEMGGSYETQPGMLLTARVRVVVPGRWLALHVALGAVDLAGRHVVGFVCRSEAPEPVTWRASLRSGTDADPEASAGGGFVDCFFPKRLVAFGEPSTHIDLLQVGRSEPLPLQAAWRELILFFERKDFEITLRDLRLFIV